MYTKRIVKEALWLQPYLGWSLQDVVDLVLTFCKLNCLEWSCGRARKQIANGQALVAAHRGAVLVMNTNPIHPLTGNAAEINELRKTPLTSPLTGNHISELRASETPILPDTLQPSLECVPTAKVSGSLKHKAAPRDAVVRAIGKHRGWIKAETIAAEVGQRYGALLHVVAVDVEDQVGGVVGEDIDRAIGSGGNDGRVGDNHSLIVDGGGQRLGLARWVQRDEAQETGWDYGHVKGVGLGGCGDGTRGAGLASQRNAQTTA